MSASMHTCTHVPDTNISQNIYFAMCDKRLKITKYVGKSSVQKIIFLKDVSYNMLYYFLVLYSWDQPLKKQ